VPPFLGRHGWHASAVEKLVRNEALRGVFQPQIKTEIKGQPKREPVGGPVVGHYPRVMSDNDWYRMQWPANERQARGRRTEGKLNNLFAELFKCKCGAGLVRDNKGKKWGAYLVCSKSRRGLCEHRTRHDLAALEAEMLMLLSLFDVSRLVEKANPHADRIAGLEAEITTKQKIINEMAEGFAGNAPPAFYKRMQTMQVEVDGATTRLTELKRNAKIAEANDHQGSHAEFRAMVAAMADVEGDELYRVRKKLDLELHPACRGWRGRWYGVAYPAPEPARTTPNRACRRAGAVCGASSCRPGERSLGGERAGRFLRDHARADIREPERPRDAVRECRPDRGIRGIHQTDPASRRIAMEWRIAS
jgi:hypothetical protein